MAYGKTPKTKTSYWIDDDRLRECEDNLKLAGCRNKSEYINKALKHYNDYLRTNESEDYLVKKMAVAIKLAFENMENRIARNQFKEAVELAKITRLMAPLCEPNRSELKRLHVECVEEVKKINGVLTFENAIGDYRSEN